ncbi:MAG TPA: DUF1003 domain-containing protein [Kamptonema sp.]|nr:DUF1003 domain-containing protein [Kamptonema sp.]
MNPTQLLNNGVETQKQAMPTQKHQQQLLPQKIEKKGTLGQRLADKMAAQVGSWSFLIGQTAVLGFWVGANLTPGMPHWDESPFILLNLVFSFASAYTAPVVLMSQNRQSEEDREKALSNHQVNVQTAEEIQRLHSKIDNLCEQQFLEVIQILKQQQEAKEFQAAVSAPGSMVVRETSKMAHLKLESYPADNTSLPVKSSFTQNTVLPELNKKSNSDFFNNFSNNSQDFNFDRLPVRTNLLVGPWRGERDEK